MLWYTGILPVVYLNGYHDLDIAEFDEMRGSGGDMYIQRAGMHLAFCVMHSLTVWQLPLPAWAYHVPKLANFA